MFSRTAIKIVKPAASSLAARNGIAASSVTPRFMGTLKETASAKSAWEKSCYFEMDFSIAEDATVYEAVQRFAAYDIGCLVTLDAKGMYNIYRDERFTQALVMSYPFS